MIAATLFAILPANVEEYDHVSLMWNPRVKTKKVLVFARLIRMTFFDRKGRRGAVVSRLNGCLSVLLLCVMMCRKPGYILLHDY